MPDQTNAELFAGIAEDIWGDRWVIPAAAYCDVSERTLRRIKGSALNGEENLQAYGAILALRAALAESLDALNALKERAGHDD